MEGTYSFFRGTARTQGAGSIRIEGQFNAADMAKHAVQAGAVRKKFPGRFTECATHIIQPLHGPFLAVARMSAYG